MAIGLAETHQFRRHHGFVSRRLHLRIEVHHRADLRPGGDLGAFELRGGGWIAGDDLRAQLVHHLGGEAGLRIVFPYPAFLLEPLAERCDGKAVAAGAPLRDHGDLGLRTLGARNARRGEDRCTASKQASAADDRHGSLPPTWPSCGKHRAPAGLPELKQKMGGMAMRCYMLYEISAPAPKTRRNTACWSRKGSGRRSTSTCGTTSWSGAMSRAKS